MTASGRLGILAVLVAAAAGCGQQGPLVLPGDARPIERVDPPPADTAPDDDDDERTRER
jgi:predicted small lipoprotein YifL